LTHTLAWLWLLPCRVRFVSAWWLSAWPERFPGMLALSACGVRVLPEVLAAGAVPAGGRTRLA